MNREQTMLQRQIDKLALAKPGQRKAIGDAVRLWGSRLYTWSNATEVTMEKQLAWLDHHQDAATYEQRFEEWVALLRQYEAACDLLRVADGVLGEKVAA